MSGTLNGVPKTVRTRGQEKRDKYVAFRWTPSEYARIDARAKAADLTLTDYVVRAALGELLDPAETARRLDELEARIADLERLRGLGGFE